MAGEPTRSGFGAKYSPRSQAPRLAQYLAVSVKVRSGLSHYRGEADLGRQKAYLSLGKELGESLDVRSLGYSKGPKKMQAVGKLKSWRVIHKCTWCIAFSLRSTGVDVCAA